MARPLDPEKRRRLLAAAIQVFARDGYRRATVGEIARRASLSKGSVYLYFADKQDLFGQAFLTFFEADLEALRGDIAAGGDPRTVVRRLFDRWSRGAAEYEEGMALFLDFLAESGRSALPDAVRRPAALLYVELRSLLADLIRAGVRAGQFRRGLDARSTAQSILAFWDGLLAGHLLLEDAVDVPRAGRVFLRTLLRGIQA